MTMSVNICKIILILLVQLPILYGVQGQANYWITPDLSHCGNRSPCQTLKEYIERNLFSRSDTTWIFLQGEHYLPDYEIYNRIVIKNATNVTLAGEYACNNTHLDLCSKIKFPSQPPGQKNRNSCLIKAGILVHMTRNFTIMNLILDQSSLRVSQSWRLSVLLTNVQNLQIHSVIIFDTALKIYLPSGHVSIFDLNTDAGLDVKIGKIGQVLVTVNISHSIFNSLHTQHRSENVVRFIFQWYGAVHIEYCNFTSTKLKVRTEPPDSSLSYPIMVQIKRKCRQKSLYAFKVKIINSVFLYHIQMTRGRFSGTMLTLSFSEKLPCNHVTILNCSFIRNMGQVIYMNVTHHTWVLLEDTHFTQNAEGGSVIWIAYESDDNALQTYNYTNAQIAPWIGICNCTFEDNVNTNVIGTSRTKFEGEEYELQNIETLNISFCRTNLFRNNVVQTVIDLKDSLLLMCVKENSKVIIEDNMKRLHKNSIAKIMIRMSPDSLILLHNNSEIKMIAHDGVPLLVDNPWPWTLNSFVKCYVYKEGGCDGGCIFQFVDKNGMYSKENDLEYFNTSIVLSHGKQGQHIQSYYPQFYNAHLQNCTLRLQSGIKIMKEYDKRQHIKLDSWDWTTIGSPPYYVCLCDPNEPENRNLWECQSEFLTVHTFYPGHFSSVGIVALGDYRITKNETVKASINLNFDSVKRVIERASGCIPLPYLDPNKLNIPESKQTLTIQIEPLYQPSYYNLQKGRIFKQFIFQVSNCPGGFVLNQTTICICNEVLANHHFKCVITAKGLQARVNYRSPSNQFWIGYWDGQMVFSDYCPSQYCNTVDATLSTTGLTLEDINTTIQCDPNNNRQGLLCSQCTPGMSSQFGSFHCAECTFVGLLLVPFAAIAGILLIVFLFLFNFTVLQGDIVGIAFYANVVGIMDEFLQKYSPRPFYIPLALINLGFGFETCFFHGMDEFAKAMIQFAFPIYLLTLLVIIIIAAHKYNLKIFRVRFVARRSVPVLATIMLLTFSGLINAVIYGLQYTTIYNVDSNKQKLIWLHQPELEYFEGKHNAVGFLCIIVFLLYLFPLMIITVFGDLLRRYSSNLWFSHFLDVFHGAFRYPFGFWFGTRLLLRIVFIIINITTNTYITSSTIFVIIASVMLIQLCLEPYRKDNVTIYRLDPERKITRKDLFKAKISKTFRPIIIDSLYLFNAVFTMVTVAISNDISSTYVTVGVCLSISLALAQLVAVTVHHAYHYFPLPDSIPQRMEALRERFIDFKARMRDRRIARRNQREPPDTTPVQITYLSASMCFNSGEYTSSSSTEEEKSDCEGSEDKMRETSI